MAGKRQPDIEQIFRERSCLKALDTLVREGCDRHTILLFLEFLRMRHFSDESWEGLTGMTRRHLRSMAGRLRASAGEVERFNSSFLGWFLAVQSGLHYLHSTPRLLRRCAETIEKQLEIAGPKRRPFHDSFKAALVVHVHKATKSWHDEEVSALIEAAEGRTYNTASHEKWRRAHASLIETVRKSLGHLPAVSHHPEI